MGALVKYRMGKGGVILNQLRVVGWKVFYGTIIENQQFFARIESTSAFSASFG